MFDTGNHNIKLTQQLIEDFARWFPNLMDFYFEGGIMLNNLSKAPFKKLEHLDLINTLPTPFQVSISIY